MKRMNKAGLLFCAALLMIIVPGCSSTKKNESSDNLPHNVLCLGNSITRHGPYDAVNWYSDHGMAASKPENDYCHVLETLMRQQNSATTVTGISIATWERDFSLDLDNLIGSYCKGKDIIVIRLGENVPGENTPLFSNALSTLIEYCQQYTEHIVLTGEYWPSDSKEMAVKKNAEKYGLQYVPIAWIWNEHQEECCPKEGDTIYDTNGEPYQIVGDFIITHPNDKGMEYIAKAIYEKIYL